MENQEMDQHLGLEQLATLVFQLARDVKHLLDQQPSFGSGQLGGEIQLPTARQRADEIQTTLAATQQSFGVAIQTRGGETK